MRLFSAGVARLLILGVLAGCGGEDRLTGVATGNLPIPTPPPLAGQSPKDVVKSLKGARPKTSAPVGKLGGPPRPQ